MTELEMIERAKMYMDKLANGVNPLDDSPIPDDEIVNQVRLSRCFFFVSDVLRRVIENGGVEKKYQEKKYQEKKAPFSLPYERRLAFSYSEIPVPISEIAKRINALKPSESMKNLNYSHITSWLINTGMLKIQTTTDGRHIKRPTPDGNHIGITVEERVGKNGLYHIVVYDKNAQGFILDNLDAIIEMDEKDK